MALVLTIKTDGTEVITIHNDLVTIRMHRKAGNFVRCVIDAPRELEIKRKKLNNFPDDNTQQGDLDPWEDQKK